ADEILEYIDREKSLADSFAAAGMDDLQLESCANMMAASPLSFEALKNDTSKEAKSTFRHLLPLYPAALGRFEKRQANAVQAKALLVSQESAAVSANLLKTVEELKRDNGKLREENEEMKRRLEES
ncbi:hypothetical protein PFISCL1PPCAC_10980, partial [Pristionchus fissidentatus]